MSSYLHNSTQVCHWNVNIHLSQAIEPRGGASIIQVSDKIIAFGGTDRNQQHFNDVLIYSCSHKTFEKMNTYGDCPTARSGHAVASYGIYMFLFGGCDFAEEIDYNDLYVLNSETMEWKYVGEGGVEVLGRNSHSLSVIKSLNGEHNYLIIYGGASSSQGPLSDTIFSLLPNEEEIANTEFHVTWENLSSISPGHREMHSSCSYNSKLYITGGRNVEGNLLADVWCLEEASDGLKWIKLHDQELEVSRCAHAAAVINVPTSGSNPLLCLFGGFTGNGEISSKMSIISLLPTGVDNGRAGDDKLKSPVWMEATLSKELTGRFGLCACSFSYQRVNSVFKSVVEESVISERELSEEVVVGFVIFGGVSAEKDFSDLCIFTPN